ncbi:hypothetical protein [Marinobacter sp.]|uniref:hypothetical protein n=1 Tax=Marinobacter sp. TaxID=50741 RepID=UPI003A8E9DC9
MLFLLIFPVLVAGYRASLIHPVESLANARHQGQRLYLSSATMGLKCFALAGIIVYLLHECLPDAISFWGWHLSLSLADYIGKSIASMGVASTEVAMNWTWFILLSIATWFAGDLLKIRAYLWQALWHGTWNIKVPVTGKLLADSPMDYLLFKAMHSRKAVMLSMNDRKVYVGYVAACAEPSQNGGAYQEVTLVPMMSGYRDEKTLKVNITTYYEDADESVELIVRQDTILSAGEFNWEAFEKLQPRKQAPTRVHIGRNQLQKTPNA